MVDEHTRQLVADGLVHEERGDGRVDAAAQRAQNSFAADRRLDAGDLLFDHGGGRPRRRSRGDGVEEVLQKVCPMRRVHDFRMELHPVQRALALLESGDGRRRRHGDDLRAGGRSGHRVTV